MMFVYLVSAAQQKEIRNLVFEGAGMRGIAYCGVLEELENRQLLKQVEKVGGTSAGALMALTVGLGYTSSEIRDLIGSTNFRKLNDGRYFLFGGINRMQRNFGWYRGERLDSWIGSIIKEKTGNENISFEEWNQKGYKGLYVTGTCLNRQSLIIFSHETYPKMKVRDAVRISMSIPLYFGAVCINQEGQVIRRPRRLDTLDIMVDGGFTGNFPIRLFDNASGPNMQTLGFRIDTEEQIKSDQVERKLVAKPVRNFNEYITAFYTMILENLNRQTLTVVDWERTVSISDGLVSPRIRKLSRQEIELLISNGKQALISYLN
jgi:NTE family protein